MVLLEFFAVVLGHHGPDALQVARRHGRKQSLESAFEVGVAKEIGERLKEDERLGILPGFLDQLVDSPLEFSLIGPRHQRRHVDLVDDSSPEPGRTGGLGYEK